jgi:hypothetical protein
VALGDLDYVAGAKVDTARDTYEARLRDKLKSNERYVLLKQMEGQDPLNSKGMVDKRLFTGENKLLVTLDPQDSLWSIKFEKGLTPGNLTQRFTAFSKAVKHIKDYYAKRNIEIDKIID